MTDTRNPDSMTQVLSQTRKITCVGVRRVRGFGAAFPEKWGRTWRVQKTSALGYRRGWRRGNHRTSKVCPFLIFLSVFLFRIFFRSAWQPHCGPLLSAARISQGSMWTRRRAAWSVSLVRIFSLPSWWLQYLETRHVGVSWSAACVCLSSSIFRHPCLATRQFGAFLVVRMKPQQSPEYCLWPHIGATFDGGIRSVSSHFSSIGLIFAYSRSR